MTTSTTAAIVTPTASASPASKVTRRRSLLATGLGNVLEWFDWAVYGVFSTYIAGALFDQENPVSALLSTLAVFAVGFVMRPLGGYVFGRIADRKGRKWVLLVTMLMMASGSLLIGIIPSYETIGGVASFLLLLARLLQGFAHGGEATVSNVYLPEIAPRHRRAFYGSAIGFAMGLGTMVAILFGSVLTNMFDSMVMKEWGWRLPFIFGGLLAVVVLWLRRNMMESEVHEAHVEISQTAKTLDDITLTQGNTAVTAEVSKVSVVVEWPNRKTFIKAVEVFFYMAGTTLPYYIWSSYAATYAITQKDMDPAGAFTASLGAMAVNLVLVPIMGLVADKIGRRIPVLVYALATAALTVPVFAMINDNPWTLFIAQALMMGLSACIGGTQPAMLAEQVPTRYRALIMGTAMPLAVALFGGTAPYLNTWLASIDMFWLFDGYIIAMTLGTAIVVGFRWKETKGIRLAEAG
ncbi:MFS transporter [Corynebacterium poyangense]|uniref:Putative proline/betaine transporter n=1 Tax=Corynebacterium poyangense TaxID=2684405 RepID=A0A7H0SRQ2_9CORY|nr:MFS transporter [Corynebacterium poyangense]MBZ8176660.1 MFS transporter [Corynebacterium poyangense]QNQ91227.1 MFS transporter [Corynebacterium poyangense]